MSFINELRHNESKRNTILWIVAFSLIAVMALGLIASFVSINNAIPTRTLSDSAFKIGLIDSDEGDYMQGTTSIYTKEYIPIDGLKCKPQEDASIEYQVFFYTEEKEYISATAVRTDIFSVEFDTVPTGARYARVMVTPLHDYEVASREVETYAKMITITYNK